MIWPKALPVAETTPTAPAADGESLRRWGQSLDALQQEAEAALAPAANTGGDGPAAHGTGPWAAPTDLGPLPAALLDQARHLAGLQERALGVLTEARAGVEHELAALNRPRTQVRPVYLDTTG
ncbi:hypothetical protein [Arthrobacter sp. STN4]|uniref:hypothetical protein n=1 Tax=Arthrobacter sp. STN4 TaxID=2923276 RepID=UPI00211A9C47|nr:hypothetical protein [Arthrobacter sp. STN4]MCQ9162497.1 hypothetical protein [Arthrobacter sp. STN4]